MVNFCHSLYFLHPTAHVLGAIHLTPLKDILQFRPSFQHISKGLFRI